MERDNILFLDTNVLLTATDESREHHDISRRLIDSAGATGIVLAVSGQIFREYLVVATRPVKVNGLGLHPSEARHNVYAFMSKMSIREETAVTAETLIKLVERYDLKGKRIHDAGVVATMISGGVRNLITQNIYDFSIFADIDAVDIPTAVKLLE